MSKLLVNLGCGLVPVPAPTSGGTWQVVNHDLTRHSKHVDVAWDLNILPWPWADSSVTLVIATAVLEHLKLTPLESINECWRILKPNGLLRLKLPLWDNEESWNDPTHRWHFGHRSLNLFDRSTERGARYGDLYGARPWRILYQGTIPNGTCLYARMEAVK